MNTQHPRYTRQDYRSSMQQAALAFFVRHQAEHLGNEQALFDRAVQHLEYALSVPQFLAEKLVALAYGELRSAGQRLQLDVASSNASTAIISDPGSGLNFAVPVELIVRYLIRDKARRRLQCVS